MTSKENEISKYELIKKTNDLIKTINLKGKDYAPVNERVMAFRRVNPDGRILTEATFTDNYVMFQATIIDDESRVLATGHAREYLKTEFALEKAETSAIGRALGLSGYGIATSLSSLEDMENVGKSEIFDEPSKDEILKQLLPVMSKQEQIDFLNSIHRTDIHEVPSYLLMALIRFKDEEKHSAR